MIIVLNLCVLYSVLVCLNNMPCFFFVVSYRNFRDSFCNDVSEYISFMQICCLLTVIVFETGRNLSCSLFKGKILGIVFSDSDLLHIVSALVLQTCLFVLGMTSRSVLCKKFLKRLRSATAPNCRLCHRYENFTNAWCFPTKQSCSVKVKYTI